jgi:hypothetical protein
MNSKQNRFIAVLESDEVSGTYGDFNKTCRAVKQIIQPGGSI